MASALSIVNPTFALPSTARRPSSSRPKIMCVTWDPEGLLGAPQTGHIARLEFKRRLEKDADAREAFQQHVREEKERRRVLRESRATPDGPEELIEYFLDTEAQELQFEIARLRPRTNSLFFSRLNFLRTRVKFVVKHTSIHLNLRREELRHIAKALTEGAEAYDKVQTDLVTAKASLAQILTSKDVKATLLEMVEQNKLNRSLLALLDENIASAHKVEQKEAAAFMEKVRGAVLKYMTA
ncbi:hypothetical protein Syun_012697 [Stephania yunnanensis]|uniref:Uncharacterized protein n=1 Tax=Stephania yunnanensis TaxID=152371 RepID=A0AAP0K288_9MAGN